MYVFILQSTDSTPNAFSYSIRFPGELRTTYTSFAITYNWKTNQLFEADAFETRYLDEDDGGPPSYYKEGFLAIQNAIATSLMNQSCPSSVVGNTIPEIFVQRFPQPGENVNELVKNIQFLMALIFLLSLNYTFMNSVRFISIEKENQLKEAMKIMGLDSWMHYLSWFIRTLTMLSISMIFITILLTVIYLFFLNIQTPFTEFCSVSLWFFFAETMVRSDSSNFSEFQFIMFVHIPHWLLHLLNYIWFCILCIFHKIKIGNDRFHYPMVCHICSVFLSL